MLGVLGAVDAGGAAERDFDRLAAVGLLSLSATSVERDCFLIGGGGGTSGAFRALAREAAVGANKPLAGVFTGVLAGVFGRAAEAGVFGRMLEGVLGRAGVVGGRTDALEDGLDGVALMFLTLDDPRSDGEAVEVVCVGRALCDVGGDFAAARVALLEVAAVVEV